MSPSRPVAGRELCELLRCDATALVINPHKRTFAETAAHVDETRKTKRWAELCEELAQFARYQGHPEKEVEAAGVMMAVTHVMARFIGNASCRRLGSRHTPAMLG